ncbi:MAG: hypothetical protein HY716_15730 [Planctomycetes bacterium]|nr:hypothetical protein [Planctomycetota bacterium]
MRISAWCVALAAVLATARAAWAQEACGGDTYGTAVSWVKDIDQAAKQAAAEGRLVMAVHLSGELDDPEKT